jgi:hypothetical protein
MSHKDLRKLIRETFEESVEEFKPIKVDVKDIDFYKHNIDGKMDLPSLENGAASSIISDKDFLEYWKNEFFKKFGEEGTLIIDKTKPHFDVFKIVGNKKLDKYQSLYRDLYSNPYSFEDKK